MNQTAVVLTRMLTENTGVHLLDSGNAYGRHWETNQFRDFEQEPQTVVTFRYGIELTHNVYHFLKTALEYDPQMDRAFHNWAKSQGKSDSWLSLMESFPSVLGNKKDPQDRAYGMHEDAYPFTVNTYNGNDLLSQVLQYTYFEFRDQGYVILQIHGGCDVRGGYTTPRVFRAWLEDFPSILDNARGTIWCTGRGDKRQTWLDESLKPPPHHWSTDDGWNWYFDGATDGPHLDDFAYMDIEEYAELPEDERPERVLLVGTDGEGYCPLCGGNLIAGY